MPVPEYTPPRVSAPFDEGVGLERPARVPDPSWPPEWWQLNMDTIRDDPDDPDPAPLTARQKQVPPAEVIE